MDCGNWVLGVGLPGQPPPIATFRITWKGRSNGAQLPQTWEPPELVVNHPLVDPQKPTLELAHAQFTVRYGELSTEKTMRCGDQSTAYVWKPCKIGGLQHPLRMQTIRHVFSCFLTEAM